MGIDTPESRTKDLVEKKFGLASKARLQELLKGRPVLQTQINKDGEDMKGKFGRILGDFILDEDGDGTIEAGEGRLATAVMIEEGHCVPYFGGSKEETQEAHKINRKRLIEEGVVELTLEEAGL
jgi:micrococcal nuclease